MGEYVKNKKKIHGLLRYGLLGFFVVMGITGCGRGTMKEPVTVTIWHGIWRAGRITALMICAPVQ